MGKRNSVILIVLIVLCSKVLAQNSFSLLFRSSLNEWVGDLVQMSNGNIVAVGSQNQSDAEPNTFKGMIWRFSSNTDTLSCKLEFGDTASYFFNIQSLENGNFLIFGSFVPSPDYYNGRKLLILEVNSNFEKVRQKSYAIPGWSSCNFEFVKKFDDKYYCFGSVTQNNAHRMCILKLNSNYDTVASRVYTNITSGTAQYMDCILSPDSSQLWAFTSNFYGGSGSTTHLVVYDTLLNFIEYKTFPFILNQVTSDVDLSYDHNMTAKWMTDSTFLIGCNHTRTFNHQQLVEEDIGFSEMDSSLSISPVTYIGATDTSDYAAFRDGTFDFEDTNSILFSGTKYRPQDFWPIRPSFIMAGMLNRGLQPVYTRYYGGDASYRVMFMKKAIDGGMIIAAMRYDHLTQLYENDVFFLKLNSAGLITEIKDWAVCPNTVFSIFPNPANDYFTLSLVMPDAVAKIYDISGKQKLCVKITGGENRINIENLLPGTYLIEITTPDNTIYSNKLIKK